MGKVYLQMYCVRQAMKQDFAAAVRRVAALGYDGIECTSFFGGLPVEEFSALLRETGLEFISDHTRKELADDEKHIEYLHKAGVSYIVTGQRFSNREETLRCAEYLNKKGKELADRGIMACYHNHSQEFIRDENGEYLQSILIENTDPATVGFELDVGWAKVGGVDPIEYINSYKGRFPLIHIKETNKVLYPEFVLEFINAPVKSYEESEALRERMMDWNVKMGEGIIDWKKLVAASDAQGTKAYIIEREIPVGGEAVFAYLKHDLDYMKML